MTEPSAQIWDLALCCFPEWKFDFWIRFTCWPFPTVPSQVFWQEQFQQSHIRLMVLQSNEQNKSSEMPGDPLPENADLQTTRWKKKHWRARKACQSWRHSDVALRPQRPLEECYGRGAQDVHLDLVQLWALTCSRGYINTKIVFIILAWRPTSAQDGKHRAASTSTLHSSELWPEAKIINTKIVFIILELKAHKCTGREAHDGRLDFHTAPEHWVWESSSSLLLYVHRDHKDY